MVRELVRRAELVGGVIAAVVAFACERQASVPLRVVAPGTVIGARGALVQGEVDGWQVTVEVPPGALEEPVALTMERHGERIPGALGPVIELGPSMQFARPVRVGVRPLQDDLPFIMPTAMQVATYVGARWDQLAPVPVLSGEVAGTTTHFSLFALVEEAPVLPVHVRDQVGTQFGAGGFDLETSEVVKLHSMYVSSVRAAVTLEPLIGRAPVELRFAGLVPGATLYVYEGDLPRGRALPIDELGRASFAQILEGRHVFWLQTDHSTLFVDANLPGGGDCGSFGTWDDASRTCTLTREVNDTIQISSADTHLDCGDVLPPPDAEGWLSLGPEPAHPIRHDGLDGVVVAHHADFASVRNCHITTFDTVWVLGHSAHVEGNVLLASGSAVVIQPGPQQTRVERNLFFVDTYLGIYAIAETTRIANNTFRSTDSGWPAMMVDSWPGTMVVTGNRVARGVGGYVLTDDPRSFAIYVVEGAAQLTDNHVVCAARTTNGIGGQLRDDALDVGAITGNRMNGCNVGAFVSWDSVAVLARNLFEDNERGLVIGPRPDSGPTPQPGWAVRVWANDFLNNTLNVDSRVAIELSEGGRGNYWGHSCSIGPPFFAPGVDSNSASVVDSYPYGVSVANRPEAALPAPPACGATQDADFDGFDTNSDCDDTNGRSTPAPPSPATRSTTTATASTTTVSIKTPTASRSAPPSRTATTPTPPCTPTRSSSATAATTTASRAPTKVFASASRARTTLAARASSPARVACRPIAVRPARARSSPSSAVTSSTLTATARSSTNSRTATATGRPTAPTPTTTTTG